MLLKTIQMLQVLITSRTRIKLLLKFFLNSNNTSYLRDLATEFGESTNSIRLELNHLEGAGLLKSRMEGNKKVFWANKQHPLFVSIRQLLLTHTGIDQIINNVVKKLRGLQKAWVIESFAQGKDHPVIDIMLSGVDIDTNYLMHLVDTAETLIPRKIRYILIKPEETKKFLKMYPEALLLWENQADE